MPGRGTRCGRAGDRRRAHGRYPPTMPRHWPRQQLGRGHSAASRRRRWRGASITCSATQKFPSLALKGVALAAMTGARQPSGPASTPTCSFDPGDWPRAHDALVAAGYTLDGRCPVPLTRDSMTRFLTFTNSKPPMAGPVVRSTCTGDWSQDISRASSSDALFERAVDVNLAGRTSPPSIPMRCSRTSRCTERRTVGSRCARWSTRTCWSSSRAPTWAGRRSLVGRSRSCPTRGGRRRRTSRRPVWLVTPVRSRRPADEPLPSFLRRRAVLAPSPASVAPDRGRHGVAAADPRPIACSAAGLVDGGRPPGRARRVVGFVRRDGAGAGRARPARGHDDRDRVVLVAAVDPAEVRATTAAPSPATSQGGTRARHRDPTRTGLRARCTCGPRACRVRPSSGPCARFRARPIACVATTSSAPATVREPRARRSPPRRSLGHRSGAGPAALAKLRAFAERAPAKLRLADGRVIDGTYAERHPDTTLVSIPGRVHVGQW